MSPEDLNTLEDILDRANLGAVLDVLSEIAHAKAEHVESNWQDSTMANNWRRAAQVCETAACRPSVRLVSL